MGPVHNPCLRIMHLDSEGVLLFVFTCHLSATPIFQIKQSVRYILLLLTKKKKIGKISVFSVPRYSTTSTYTTSP